MNLTPKRKAALTKVLEALKSQNYIQSLQLCRMIVELPLGRESRQK